MEYKRYFESLQLLILAASVSLNCYQALRLRDFKRLLQSHMEIQVGTVVGSLSVSDAEGRAVDIQLLNTKCPIVLYIVSPSCRWCDENAPRVSAVFNRYKYRAHFYAISLLPEGLPEFVQRTNLAMPVFTMRDLRAGRLLKLGATPQTIVIGSNGKVHRVWTGLYDASFEKEIGTALAASEF